MADYNINAVTRRKVFSGSAGTGPYSFTFEVLDQNDLAVYKNATKLTLTTDYTVTVNANGTGDVNLVLAATSSDTVTIIGARDIERTTDFVTAGDLRASALNEQLDALTIFDQQIAEENKRQIIAPVEDPEHVDDGGTLDMTLPPKDTRKGKYLAFNSTTGNPEAGASSDDVATLAAITDDIATLADIEDGTDATDAIQTVAGISSNVSTVAGISSNVSTVAGISANVTTVAGNNSNVSTVASNISSVNTVATNIADVVTVANDLNEAISEIETAADDLNEAVSEIDTVATSITNVDAVGTNIANVNTVAGISSNVTTVAGISGNVTTVAGIASDVTTVAADGTDIGTVAGISSNVSTVAGISANVTTVAGVSSDVTTVAGISSNVTTVATNNANVTTVASNITGVNSFAERYRVGSADPTTSLDEGDLAYNSTSNQLKYYNGSSWEAISPGITDVVSDTTPQLGGNLDVNGNSIVSVSNGDISITPNGSGKVILDGLSHPTSDGSAGQFLKTDGGGNLSFATVTTDLSGDTTPQLGGNLDVVTHSIVSTSNRDITINPNGTGNVLIGNYEFDADQSVGAGQDNYVLTYDNSTGHVSLEAAAAAGATGGGSDEIFYENGQNVTTDYTITNGKNAMSAGPITINSGVTVTVGTGETWTVV